MKIMIICDVPTKLGNPLGGVQAVIVNFIKIAKKDTQNEYIIVSFNKINKSYVEKTSENVSIYRFKSNNCIPELLNIIILKQRIIYNLSNRIKPDIINFHGSGPNLMSLLKLPNKKVIITQHGISTQEVKYQNGPIMIMKFLFKSIVDILYLRTFKNRIFISNYGYRVSNLKKSFKFAIINNALSDIYFCYNATIPNNEIYYVGWISKLKNFSLILKALHLLKEEQYKFKLHIYGEFRTKQYKKQVYEYILNNGLKDYLVFHGYLDSSSLMERIKSHTYFVLPSNQENLPMSIAESQALGKIVLASKVGGIPEMITDGKDGFLFDPNNEIELFNKLKSCFDGKFDIHCISDNAFNRAKDNYNGDLFLNKTLKFYKEVIDK